MVTSLTTTFDGIFYVTSAVCVNGRLSIYTDEERFHQTAETIRSIKRHCPNSMIYLIDVSDDPNCIIYLRELARLDAQVIYLGDKEPIRSYSQHGMKSQGELTALMAFLDWFDQQDITAKRIYKVSGRYHLNEHFKLGLEYENQFVFLKSENSWMPPGMQDVTGMRKFFETRLYHMDFNLLPVYKAAVPKMLEVCNTYNVNIEHAIYHVLYGQNVVELDRVGLTGNIAPSGELKND